MKKIFFISLFFLLSICVTAQVIGSIHKKLAQYYEKEQWEDCAFKADRMILQDKYQNDAEVYLYLAASYNKIFLMCLEDSTLLNKVPEYLNSYKFALQYSTTAKKKDKKIKYYFPKNNFLLEEIAIAGMHYVDHFIEIRKYAKANSYMRKILKTYSDYNLTILNGVLTVMTGDSIMGKEIIQTSLNSKNEVGASVSKKTDFIMIDAIDLYAGFLIKDTANREEATNLVLLGLKFFPNEGMLAHRLKQIKDPNYNDIKPLNSKKADVLKQIKFNTKVEGNDDLDNDDD